MPFLMMRGDPAQVLKRDKNDAQQADAADDPWGRR